MTGEMIVQACNCLYKYLKDNSQIINEVKLNDSLTSITFVMESGRQFKAEWTGKKWNITKI